MLSKKIKLPKIFWQKGKSKYFYQRCVQEGISFGKSVWNGTITLSPMDMLYKKLLKQ